MGESSHFQVDEPGLNSLKFLYQEICSLVAENTLVVIDQVSILSCMGFTPHSIYTFCHYLVGEESVQLVRLLQQLGELNLSVAGLVTGQSRDVSGVITMQDRKERGVNRTFQFRVEDKTVKIFAPGTSSAVL